MADFKRRASNSPFCLGMTDFCCYNSVDVIAEKMTLVNRKKLSLAKLAPLTLSRRFNNSQRERNAEGLQRLHSCEYGTKRKMGTACFSGVGGSAEQALQGEIP